MKQFNRPGNIGITLAAAIFIAGCANIPASKEQIAVSKVTIDNAVNEGSRQFAEQQLKSALEKIDAAEQAIADKDYLSARHLAEQAQADAQLAAAMARSAKARKVARELQESNLMLQQETERNAQ